MIKKKEPRWQQEQKQRKKYKSRQIVGFILAIIFFILIAGVSWRVYSDFKNSIWDGRNRLNLVLNTNPISLVSFDPSSQAISFLTIPDGTYIEVVGNYGPYRIEKIFSLGKLEGRGIELLTASLETYFGLPVDGWIEAEEKWQGTGEAKRLLSGLIGLGFKEKSLTNLSRWDLIRLWLMVNQTRGHKVETVDLGETTITEEFSLPDGTQAKRVDQERISRIISNLFTDYQLRQEDLGIAIMNAGGEAGLAAKAARLITNIGGRLVEVGDWPEKLTECQIRTTPVAKKTYTAQKFAKVFNCQLRADSEKESRWDILIILTGESW